MPIRRELRWLYPIDWRELSMVIRFKRAQGRCEGCGRPHGKLVVHLGDGRWWDEERQTWRCGKGRTLRRLPAPADDRAHRRTTCVVLATAHLNHDPSDNRPGNLRALCQRCHILHDKDEHRHRRWLTYRARRALGDLFIGSANRSATACPGFGTTHPAQLMPAFCQKA